MTWLWRICFSAARYPPRLTRHGHQDWCNWWIPAIRTYAARVTTLTPISGAVPVTGRKPVRVISSAMRDLDVASSSSGLLALRSDRSGFSEIWISRKDGQSEKKVTSLENFTGSPRWSPDERRPFDSRRTNAATPYLPHGLRPGAHRVRSTHAGYGSPGLGCHSELSAEGSHIYFASQRSGQWQVWKIPADGNHEPAR